MSKKLVIGLGNFPKEYENTKHNVGFKAIDIFCNKNSLKLDHEKFSGVFAHLKFGDQMAIVGKPYTYMNLSGEFVRRVCDFYKILPSDILVIYDDVDTEFGKFRVRLSGSSGGQKGIKSIIENMNTEDIKRVRIGIGKPSNSKMNLADHVLSKFTASENKVLEQVLVKTSDIIYDFVTGTSFEKIISKYN